ncbi:hypothetical protein BI364_08170 [Acidihalobacter yilgarnensis]|uniref:Direct oxygen-sensing cyclase n=2 Tax=Acidihalobacter yilgarnensis TaxID=2819280 RepID=A0A1D8IN88_9GAMM|nr:hypothetical protein BI364_08170 [Acidihalobacter yilgarnensis]
MTQTPANDANFFHRLSVLLARARSADGLLAGLAPLLADWGVEDYWLGSVNPDGRIVCEYANSDDMTDYVAELSLRWDEGPWAQGPSGLAVRTDRPMYIPDWQETDDATPWQATLVRFGWRSSAALPLRIDASRQILALYSRTPGTFGHRHTQLSLEELANLLGVFLARETALTAERRKLAQMALRDPLTDLPNRAALDIRLDEALARAKRRERLLAVCLLDLDDFKPINDTLGHAAGDAVLRELAQRLQSTLRTTDFAARLGGDEFVFLLEEIDAMDDVESLLDRLHEALTRQITLEGGAKVRVRASLGIVVYPLCLNGEAEGAGMLLRAADQALYITKAEKSVRQRWWTLFDPCRSLSDAPTSEQSSDPPHAENLTGYGPAAHATLTRVHETLLAQVVPFLEVFYAHFVVSPGAAPVLHALSEDQRRHHFEAIAGYLRLLLDPALTQADHRREAAHLGWIHAMIGVEAGWGVEAYDLWAQQIQSALPQAGAVHAVLSRRICVDVQTQLESYAAISEARNEALRRIDALSWRATRFADLAQGVVEALTGLDEVAAVTIGRPNADDVFTFEFVAGNAFKAYLEMLAEGRSQPIKTDASPEGQGPTGRAWRSGQIERCLNYATDPRLAPWREVAQTMGVYSNAAVPLAAPDNLPQAVLTLYSPYPGGYCAREPRRLLEHLHQVLGLSLPRLETVAPATQAFQTRRRWLDLLEQGGLVMHYQPIIDLYSGRTTGVEALARLRDGSGKIILPDRFLPAFTSDDLLQLFERGLRLALGDLAAWDEVGCELTLSVNLPTQGLADTRYLDVLEAALARGNSPPGRLMLELLESAEVADEAARDRGIVAFKALGVQLAEDDLGSGHSSLLRLDRLPFDVVKIDQGLVRHEASDVLRTLTFIRYLTRLAQDMGKRVVVEGLESSGLVEAAALLGANHGQGYAIARPMPAADIPAWIETFRLRIVQNRPATALGALAVFMHHDGCAIRFANTPWALEHLLQAAHPLAHYIGTLGIRGEPLARACDRLMALARQGPGELVEESRNKVVRLLVAQSQLEHQDVPPD